MEGRSRRCLVAGNNYCGTHHQSPINVVRNVAIPGNEFFKPCFDVHWMQYHDSSCSLGQLAEMDAVSSTLCVWQMAALSIFLDVYPDQPDWRMLTTLICEWRAEERRVLNDCGSKRTIPSYSGGSQRRLREETMNTASTPALSMHDLICTVT